MSISDKRTEELETLIQNASPQYLAQKFFELETMVNTLQAQLLAVTNENRKLLDPSGELLPPLTAIKGE